MNDRKPLELEECPDCRGTGALCHEGGWCVYVECLDCGAHTAYVEYANPEEQDEAERRSAALWNMGKVIHMRPGRRARLATTPGPAIARSCSLRVPHSDSPHRSSPAVRRG